MSLNDESTQPEPVIVRDEVTRTETGRERADELINPTGGEGGLFDRVAGPKKPRGITRVESLMDDAEEQDRKVRELLNQGKSRFHRWAIKWCQRNVDWLDENFVLARNFSIVLTLSLVAGLAWYTLANRMTPFPCGSTGQFTSQGVTYQVIGATSDANGNCINKATGELLDRRDL